MTLPKFTLTYNDKQERWDLKNDRTNRTVESFDTKQEATARGVLKEAIGGEGSVKIQKADGTFQEERTFPRSQDPEKSPG